MPSFSITAPAANSSQIGNFVTVNVQDMSGGMNTGYQATCTDIASGTAGPTSSLSCPTGSSVWNGIDIVPGLIPTTAPPQPNNKTVSVQAMQGWQPSTEPPQQVSFYAYSLMVKPAPPPPPSPGPIAYSQSPGAKGSTAKPKSAKPKAAKPKAAKPKPAKPKAAKPKARPKAAKSKAAKPKAAKPKAAKPKAAKKPPAKKGKKKKK
jgi:hypothetical protein